MTIIELIHELNKYPNEAEVVLYSGDGEEYYTIDDVVGEKVFDYGKVVKVWIK